eukprot:403334557
MRESIIGNFLIDKAQSINEQKRKDSSLSQILDDRDQISNSRQKEEDFLFKSYQPQTLNQDQNFMRASNDIQNNTHFKPERRVSFKKESQTPALNSVKMMPQMFMGTPTLLNAYFQKKCLEVNFELPKDQTVRFGNCKGNKICNYRAESTYQWPVKPTLYLNMTDISTLDLWGYCIEPNSWENGQLLPGRSCNSDYQCYSSLCSDGKCKGLVYPAACRISKDCEAGYRCTPDYSYKPDRIARNVCVKVQTEGQNCTMTTIAKINQFVLRMERVKLA